MGLVSLEGPALRTQHGTAPWPRFFSIQRFNSVPPTIFIVSIESVFLFSFLDGEIFGFFTFAFRSGLDRCWLSGFSSVN